MAHPARQLASAGARARVGAVSGMFVYCVCLCACVHTRAQRHGDARATCADARATDAHTLMHAHECTRARTHAHAYTTQHTAAAQPPDGGEQFDATSARGDEAPGRAGEEETALENQIAEYIALNDMPDVPGADDGDEGRETWQGRSRQRARRRGGARSEASAFGEGDEADDSVGLQKTMRRCKRRVRDGGADAVAPSIEKLCSVLARMDAAGEAQGSEYDMVITFSLRAWQEHGSAREGLVAALDLVATALSCGHRPSVRTFNEIFQAFAAAGNPDLPHPSGMLAY